MATRVTLQELEDIIPTRCDYGLNSPSTSHSMVGRDRPGKNNARFGGCRICVRQHQDEFETVDSPVAQGLVEDHEPRVQKKRSGGRSACHQINDVQGTATVEGTRKGTSKETFLESFYHRKLEKSTLRQNALERCHSDQTHRKEPKSYSILKAMVSDALADKQQHRLIGQKQKGRVKDRAIPVASRKTKVTGNEEIVTSGHRKARAREA